MGDREVRRSRGGMEGMDSPIGNWSPDKPVIRKSLSRASKEQRAGYSSFIRYVQMRPVGGHLDSSKRNVSQCEYVSRSFLPLVSTLVSAARQLFFFSSSLNASCSRNEANTIDRSATPVRDKITKFKREES